LPEHFAMSNLRVVGWCRRCGGGVAFRWGFAVALALAFWFAGGRATAQNSPPVLDSRSPSPWEAPGAPPPSTASWGTPTPAEVYVDLRADDPHVRIDRLVGSLTTPICTAPCRRLLPRDGIYVIQGDGVPATSHFELPADRQQVTLDVRAGSSGRRVAGGALIAVGVVVGYIGVLAVEASTLSNSFNNSPSAGTQGPSAWSVALLGGGLVATLAGVYLCVTTHTTVVSSTGNTFTVAPSPPRKQPRVALTPRGLEF
jgi:hypothetical protein